MTRRSYTMTTPRERMSAFLAQQFRRYGTVVYFAETRRVTLEDFARYLGADPGAVRAWIAGADRPSLDEVDGFPPDLRESARKILTTL